VRSLELSSNEGAVLRAWTSATKDTPAASAYRELHHAETQHDVREPRCDAYGCLHTVLSRKSSHPCIVELRRRILLSLWRRSGVSDG
jgi:hypothetical protein